MAYVGARIIYRLGTEVVRERELGSYQLDSRIGQGGMGEVWRARHRMLVRPAAIKLIRPDRIGSAGEKAANIVRRFEREAQATAALQSPHTVELYDFGVTEDGTLYYVMEMLDGLDMDSLVRRFGPVPWNRAGFLLRQVCHSLREAHECGLVHRDIKPANIFVCRFGLDYDFVKVLDFGLVRRDGRRFEEETLLTRDGFVGGTPAFLPPEMVLGKAEIDGRTDIYAVGCVAYWLLTGELVFDGESPMELAMKHVQEIPIPLSKRTELEIPEELEEKILRCLRKNPLERPQSAADLVQFFEECTVADSWTQFAAAQWWSKHLPNTITP
jgi:serine/threonine-protein kinase